MCSSPQRMTDQSTNRPTDRPTSQRTDRRTDRPNNHEALNDISRAPRLALGIHASDTHRQSLGMIVSHQPRSSRFIGGVHPDQQGNLAASLVGTRPYPSRHRSHCPGWNSSPPAASPHRRKRSPCRSSRISVEPEARHSGAFEGRAGHDKALLQTPPASREGRHLQLPLPTATGAIQPELARRHAVTATLPRPPSAPNPPRLDPGPAAQTTKAFSTSSLTLSIRCRFATEQGSAPRQLAASGRRCHAARPQRTRPNSQDTAQHDIPRGPSRLPRFRSSATGRRDKRRGAGMRSHTANPMQPRAELPSTPRPWQVSVRCPPAPSHRPPQGAGPRIGCSRASSPANRRTALTVCACRLPYAFQPSPTSLALATAASIATPSRPTRAPEAQPPASTSLEHPPCSSSLHFCPGQLDRPIAAAARHRPVPSPAPPSHEASPGSTRQSSRRMRDTWGEIEIHSPAAVSTVTLARLSSMQRSLLMPGIKPPRRQWQLQMRQLAREPKSSRPKR